MSTWHGQMVQQPFNRAFLVLLECPFDPADNAAKSFGCEVGTPVEPCQHLHIARSFLVSRQYTGANLVHVCAEPTQASGGFQGGLRGGGGIAAAAAGHQVSCRWGGASRVRRIGPYTAVPPCALSLVNYVHRLPRKVNGSTCCMS